MKKLFFWAVLILLGTTATHAQGDSSSSSTRLGVKAGVNLANVSGDDADDFDMRTGIHIGGLANFGITELFSVQTEVLYSMRGFKDGEIVIKIDYIEVPVMADFEIADGLSLQGGPVLGFNISGKVDDGTNEADLNDVSTLNAGVGIGAQYELPMGLFFQARYDMAFNDVIDNDFDAKNCNLGFSVGWFF